MISVAQWEAMIPAQKSQVIFDIWQIPQAAERLGAAWKVVKLLTSWGYTVEWVPFIEEPDPAKRTFYCDIRPGESPKVHLETGIGYGHTLSESLCCAALRSVGLLALR